MIEKTKIAASVGRAINKEKCGTAFLRRLELPVVVVALGVGAGEDGGERESLPEIGRAHV